MLKRAVIFLGAVVAVHAFAAPLSAGSHKISPHKWELHVSKELTWWMCAGLRSDSAPKVACGTFTSPPLVMRMTASPTNVGNYVTSMGGGSFQKTTRCDPHAKYISRIRWSLCTCNCFVCLISHNAKADSRTSENKPEDGNAAADSMFKKFDKYRNKISKVLD